MITHLLFYTQTEIAHVRLSFPTERSYKQLTCIAGAHRAHIALSELGLPYREEHVDYSVPRTPLYLMINPRGQVPTLLYGSHVIRESAIVAQFLADSVPETHLTPRTGQPDGALMRMRIAFFVETYFSKANTYYYPAIAANTEKDAAALGIQFVSAVSTDIEPLLHDAAPFFGGSSMLTMAEVCFCGCPHPRT